MSGRLGGTGEIPVGLQAPQLVAHAEDLARYLLGHDPERLAHSAAVAERARLLTAATSADAAPFLVAAVPAGRDTAGVCSSQAARVAQRDQGIF